MNELEYELDWDFSVGFLQLRRDNWDSSVEIVELPLAFTVEASLLRDKDTECEDTEVTEWHWIQK